MPDCFLLGEPRKLSAMKTIDSVPMEQVGENAEDVQQPTATAEAVDEPQNVTAEESVEPAERVDFSDEEAMLAAEQADVALGEEAEGEEPSGDATVSYSGKSKAELALSMIDFASSSDIGSKRLNVFPSLSITSSKMVLGRTHTP